VRFWCALVALLALQAPGPVEVAGQESSRPSFAEFLAGVRDEALVRGIRPEILDVAFSDLEAPLSIVLERDRSQAETILTLEAYLARRVTPKIVARARSELARHRMLLEDVATRYGVAPQIVVAIWGLESNFGRFSGIRPIVAALATLAWDQRRPALFRAELFAALEILNHGDVEPRRMRGSWAGAMGQVQFMPSSYLAYAQDFDGDGRRDIWSSAPDVFASIANFLKGHGWAENQTWGDEVRFGPDTERHIAEGVAKREGTCHATRDMTAALPMKEWQRLGVRLRNGRALPATDTEAALVSGANRHFLVYRNYDALLDYNCSHAYAVSVGMLASSLAQSQPPQASRPATRRRR
jgi:membrane-bound lytic murein transglycosylase B